MKNIIFISSLLFSFFLFPSVLFCSNPGDVIITEIIQNPKEVTDTNGEWFEIYNTTNEDIDLNNWIIKDNDFDEHVISSQLIIPARGFLVLGRNTNSAENGNYVCHYQYESFILSNTDDEIILLDNAGAEIDRVEYDDGIVWADPNGASMALINFTFDNNDGSNWTTSQARQGSYSGETGDLGSPGTLGVEQQLPVLLISFSVNMVEDGILIQWQTGLEINNLGFKIQRSIDSNENFETISDLIPGQGNSINQVNYSFVDQTAVSGQNYFYRIMDVSFDGTVKYHPAISILYLEKALPNAFSITSIYPNPVNTTNSEHTINLQIDVPQIEGGKQGILSVFNLLGQKIFYEKLYLKPGKMKYKKRLPSKMNTGVYFIQVQCEGYVDRTRFLVLQ